MDSLNSIIIFISIIISIGFLIAYRKRPPIMSKITLSNRPYFWQYIPYGNSGLLGHAILSIEADFPFKFYFDKKDRSRKLAQQLGFTSIFKSGDPVFDNLIFMTCDDSSVCERVQESAELRSKICGLLEKNILRLYGSQNRLSVKIKEPYTISEKAIWGELKIDTLVEDMEEMKRKLTLSASSGPLAYAHPNRMRALISNSAIIALPVLGAVANVMINNMPCQMVQVLQFMLFTSIVSIAPVTLGIACIYKLFHHSSYGYQVIVNFVRMGIAGIVLLTYATLYYINVRYDNTPTQTYDSLIIDKHIVHFRTDKIPRITITGWHHANTTYSSTTMVNDITYAKILKGHSIIRLYCHPGFLGFEWIEHSEIIKW